MPETHFDLDRSHIFSIDYARSTDGNRSKGYNELCRNLNYLKHNAWVLHERIQPRLQKAA